MLLSSLSRSLPFLLTWPTLPFYCLVGVRLGVQGNIGTTLYQSMSHSPPYPSSPLHASSCIAFYTRPVLRYNPASWLVPRDFCPRFFNTGAPLDTYQPRFLFSFFFLSFFFRASRTFDSFEGSFQKRFYPTTRR